jgi:hypothetical protein
MRIRRHAMRSSMGRAGASAGRRLIDSRRLLPTLEQPGKSARLTELSGLFRPERGELNRLVPPGFRRG